MGYEIPAWFQIAALAVLVVILVADLLLIISSWGPCP